AVSPYWLFFFSCRRRHASFSRDCSSDVCSSDLGTGLHSGLRARMTVHPASAEYGIWFRRSDVIGRDPMVQAHWSAVENARLCTEVSNAQGVKVSTIEHLMAALAGCGIH